MMKAGEAMKHTDSSDSETSVKKHTELNLALKKMVLQVEIKSGLWEASWSEQVTFIGKRFACHRWKK